MTNMSHTQQTILSNTLRPFSESIGSLCIDLRNEHNITTIDKKSSMNGLLYVESHIESLNAITDYQKIIGVSLPGAFPGLHWVSFNNNIFYGLAKSDVFVASNEFSKFAFFIEADLCDERNYQSSLKKLHEFTQIFRKTLQKHVRELCRIKMQYDFLFDYRKAKLFHPDGVLVSKDIESIL